MITTSGRAAASIVAVVGEDRGPRAIRRPSASTIGAGSHSATSVDPVAPARRGAGGASGRARSHRSARPAARRPVMARPPRAASPGRRAGSARSSQLGHQSSTTAGRRRRARPGRRRVRPNSASTTRRGVPARGQRRADPRRPAGRPVGSARPSSARPWAKRIQAATHQRRPSAAARRPPAGRAIVCSTRCGSFCDAVHGDLQRAVADRRVGEPRRAPTRRSRRPRPRPAG